jgi:hypothetical protein
VEFGRNLTWGNNFKFFKDRVVVHLEVDALDTVNPQVAKRE